MKNTTIAFDVDGTLIDPLGRPRYDVISFLKQCLDFGMRVYVWSGGGVEYAKNRLSQLGLDHLRIYVVNKGDVRPHIAVDDEEVLLGAINLRTQAKMEVPE